MYRIFVAIFLFFSSAAFSNVDESFEKKIEQIQNSGEAKFISEAVGVWKCDYIGNSGLNKNAVLVVSKSEISLYPSNDIVSFDIYEFNGFPINNEYIIAHPDRWHAIRTYNDKNSIELKFKYNGNILSMIRIDNDKMDISNLVCYQTK